SKCADGLETLVIGKQIEDIGLLRGMNWGDCQDEPKQEEDVADSHRAGEIA
ncbi:MAG: hypothetical protein HN996_04360, partial [Opitutae bacterium]|nr:hypothetical protein [Opitutae bacterium]